MYSVVLVSLQQVRERKFRFFFSVQMNSCDFLDVLTEAIYRAYNDKADISV